MKGIHEGLSGIRPNSPQSFVVLSFCYPGSIAYGRSIHSENVFCIAERRCGESWLYVQSLTCPQGLEFILYKIHAVAMVLSKKDAACLICRSSPSSYDSFRKLASKGRSEVNFL